MRNKDERWKVEREEGRYRIIILGNWGTSVPLCEMRCPYRRLVPGSEMIDEKDKQQ